MNARRGLIIDTFAGAGGTSEGIKIALGRSPDFAINHDSVALAVHAANHRETEHIITDIFEVRPRSVTKGRPVALFTASPDCRDFSRAKGGAPVSKRVRSLAWSVTAWANDVRPAVIIVENVPEFRGWGPLDSNGERIDTREGELFRNWVRRLERLGYRVEHRVLDSSHYGAHTKRQRLFVIARCDGRPIRWPAATHGGNDLFAKPLRPAWECINWSRLPPSIFGRERPLAESTLKRIAAGVQRFILKDPNPFVVSLDGRLAVPFLVARSYGERPGQAPRIMDIRQPLGTVVAGGQKHALVAAFVASHFGGETGIPLTGPTRTITTKDHHGLVTARLEVDDDAGAERVCAFLTTYYGQGIGQSLDAPLRTITTKDRFALVTVRGTGVRLSDIGHRMLEPGELLAAQFGESAASYDLRPAKTLKDKVRLIGNSVVPAVMAALVRANVSRSQLSEVACG